MSKEFTNVFAEYKRNGDFVEIEPEYVYMTIPAEYVCIYHRILVMLADFGVEMLKDCQAACGSKNRKIIDCFNMFNAAVAARKIGQEKLAKTLIDYIKAQIDLNYNGEAPSPEIVYPVDREGKIKAVVGCAETPKFMIDAESGQLWQESVKDLETVYALGDNDVAFE